MMVIGVRDARNRWDTQMDTLWILRRIHDKLKRRLAAWESSRCIRRRSWRRRRRRQCFLPPTTWKDRSRCLWRSSRLYQSPSFVFYLATTSVGPSLSRSEVFRVVQKFRQFPLRHVSFRTFSTLLLASFLRQGPNVYLCLVPNAESADERSCRSWSSMNLHRRADQ